MQAIGFTGVFASAAKIAFRCRCRMGLWECGQFKPRIVARPKAPERIVHMLSTLSAPPPRTKNSRTTRKDQNTGCRLSSSLEADELEPAQP